MSRASRRPVVTATCVLCVALSSARSLAQDDRAIPLTDARVDVARLTSGASSQQSTFLIDDAETVRIHVIGTIPLASVQIQLPGGGTVTPANAEATYGGSYREIQITDPDPACASIPFLCMPGSHHFYELPSQGTGNYTVTYGAADPLCPTCDAAVLIEVVTDSPIRVAVTVLPAKLKAGSSLTIATLVFDGDTAVQGATVTAHVKPSTGAAYTDVPLLDDGNFADAQAGDGVYSATFSTLTALTDTYDATVEISGTSRGFPFQRQTATRFYAYVPPAKFSSSLGLSDQGIDSDTPPNGLFDRFEISAKVDVSVTGDYSLVAFLDTPNDGALLGLLRQHLTAGMGRTIKADVSAEDVLENGEDGPFEMTELQLVYHDPQPEGELPTTVDELAFDPVYNTSSYAVVNFDRSPLIIHLDDVTSQAVDTDGPPDGLYNALTFQIPFDFLLEGTYTSSAALMGACGSDVSAEIARTEGQFQVQAPWTNPVVVTVEFDGAPIGEAGIDGIYELKNLVITGPTSFLGWDVAQTSTSYLASQFEGWAGLPDCDSNLVSDVCDLAIDPNRDCDNDGMLDACGTPETGACCDLADGTCTDGISACLCPGKFEVGESCATISPACDSGACCVKDGPESDHCDPLLTTEAQCAGEQQPTIFVLGGVCGQSGLCPWPTCYDATGCCFEERTGEIGCNDVWCCDAVCRFDSYCCNGEWDDVCVDEAADLCGQNYSDCNGNGLPDDTCDIAEGNSQDCNSNAVPDECDIESGLSADCDYDAIPDECMAPLTGACCESESGQCVNGVSECDCLGRFALGTSCAALQPPCTHACCQSDGSCSDETLASCAAIGVLVPGSACNDPGMSCPTCPTHTGDCCQPHASPCCENANCSTEVCIYDSFCCDVVWDSTCALEAGMVCDVSCPGPVVDPPLIITTYPHGARKQRYVSFAPQGSHTYTAFQIQDIGSGGPWYYISTPRTSPASIVGQGLTFVVSDTTPILFDWSSLPAIHVGGCMIAPGDGLVCVGGPNDGQACTADVFCQSPAGTCRGIGRDYEVRATSDGINFSTSIVVTTAARPNASNGRFWADVVGPFNSTLDPDTGTSPATPINKWRPPDGVTGGFDISAALQVVSSVPTAPHFTWTDVNPELTDRVTISADVLRIVNAFNVGSGKEFYPFAFPQTPTTIHGPTPPSPALCPVPPLMAALSP
ncbi:MAG: hypothetical protein J5J06_13925 [Phycisphaerae bacterium]|nr:hypothetical protein [Phycisphaerae bacterium]